MSNLTESDARQPKSAGEMIRDTGLIDISSHLRTLWRRRKKGVAITAAGIVLAGLYLMVTPSQYTALTTILVDPRQEHTTDANAVLPGLGTDSAAIASQVNVLESRNLLERVFVSENLAEDPEFSRPGLLSQLLALVRGTTPEVSPAAAFDEFRRRVAVQRLGLTYVLDVRFTARDPVKAARIANAIVDAYLIELAREKSDANLAVTGQLEERIGTLQKELTQAELAVEQFRVEHDILASGAGTTVLQSQIDQLTAQLSVAREQSRSAANRAEQARQLLALANGVAGIDDLLVSETGAQLRTQHNQLSAEHYRLQVRLGARHPSLIATAGELAGLEALMQAEARRTGAQLDAEAELAAQNVVRGEAELTALASRLGGINRDEVELRQLERNAQVARNLLEEFMRRARETAELGNMQNADARVLSVAAEPRSATWPKASLILAVAAALASTIGCAAALVLKGPAPKAATTDPAPAPSPSPTTPPRRRPSFARAGLAWKSLGNLPARTGASTMSAQIARFIDAERNAEAKSFFAGVSTLSSDDARTEAIYALAARYASSGTRTLLLDLDPIAPALARRFPLARISELTGAPDLSARPKGGNSLVVIDDRRDGTALPSNLLQSIEKLARDLAFDLILVNCPSHGNRRSSKAVAGRLDAEVLIVRSEEILANKLLELAAHSTATHPVAYLAVAAVPALVHSAPSAERRKQDAV